MSGLVIPGRKGIIGVSPSNVKAPPFDEENDWKERVFNLLGDLDDFPITFNDVLVAKYERDKVSANLIASVETKREDMYQGVCGLVLTLGPTAFKDDENNKFPEICKTIKRGHWVMYRSSDGWDKDIRAVKEYTWVHCRMIQDAHIRARPKYPGRFL